MKKSIKVLFLICISLFIGVGITYTCSINPLILKPEITLNINFILFGFLLTVYTFIITSLNKLKSDLRNDSSDNYKDHKANEKIKAIDSYKKELKENILIFLTITIVTIFLDFIINIKAINNISLLSQLLSGVIVSAFVFNLVILFDTVMSIFNIVDLEQ